MVEAMMELSSWLRTSPTPCDAPRRSAKAGRLFGQSAELREEVP